MNDLISWAIIITGIGFFFDYMERIVKEDHKKKLSNWINNTYLTDVQEKIRNLNSIFISLFEWIYSTPQNKKSNFYWSGFLSGFIVLLLISIITKITNLMPLSTDKALLIAISVFVLNSFSYRLFYYLEETSYKLFNHLIAPIAPFFLGVCLGIITSVFGEGLFSKKIIYIPCILVIGVGVPVIAELLKNKNIPVSPIKAVISSLISIILVGLFYHESAISFINLVSQGNLFLLFYIGINIFVDCVSLLETYFVLKIIQKMRLHFILLFILLDLIISAFIFLLLVFSLGELNNLIDAFLFNGPQKWLVILFWSTFFTSFFFYLFTFSSFIAFLLKAFLLFVKLLSKYIKITEMPFRSIGFISVVIISIIFVLK